MIARCTFGFTVGRFFALGALAIWLAACAPSREPAPPAPATEAAAAASARRPLPEIVPPPGTSAPQASNVAPGAVPRLPASAFVVPPGALYVCVSESGGASLQTVIQYEGKTDAVCRKHPEMGPCQYERNACRRGGGRVYAADGTEITLATEAEYDRKVRRVQFKAN
jgi:hypothetical protein